LKLLDTDDDNKVSLDEYLQGCKVYLARKAHAKIVFHAHNRSQDDADKKMYKDGLDADFKASPVLLTKVFISGMQVTQLAQSFELQWPEALRKLFEYEQKGSGGSFVTIDCFFTGTYPVVYTKQAAIIFVALILAPVCLSIFWFALVYRYKLNTQPDLSPDHKLERGHPRLGYENKYKNLASHVHNMQGAKKVTYMMIRENSESGGDTDSILEAMTPKQRDEYDVEREKTIEKLAAKGRGDLIRAYGQMSNELRPLMQQAIEERLNQGPVARRGTGESDIPEFRVTRSSLRQSLNRMSKAYERTSDGIDGGTMERLSHGELTFLRNILPIDALYTLDIVNDDGLDGAIVTAPNRLEQYVVTEVYDEGGRIVMNEDNPHIKCFNPPWYLARSTENDDKSSIAIEDLANEAVRSYLWEQCWDRFIMSLSILIFVVHPVAVVSTMSMFSCTEIDSVNVLFNDTLQVCYSDDHLWWILTVGVPGLIFILGIPVYTYTTLTSRADDIKTGDVRTTRQYAFVFADFKDEFVYWESCIQSRKLAMGCVVALLPPAGVETQTMVALGVLVICIGAQVQNRPFHADKIDQMEFYSLVCSFGTLYLGLLLHGVGSTNTTAATVFTLAIVLVNFFFVAKYFHLLGSVLRARFYKNVYDEREAWEKDKGMDTKLNVTEFMLRVYCRRCCCFRCIEPFVNWWWGSETAEEAEERESAERIESEDDMTSRIEDHIAKIESMTLSPVISGAKGVMNRFMRNDSGLSSPGGIPGLSPMSPGVNVEMTSPGAKSAAADYSKSDPIEKLHPSLRWWEEHLSLPKTPDTCDLETFSRAIKNTNPEDRPENSAGTGLSRVSLHKQSAINDAYQSLIGSDQSSVGGMLTREAFYDWWVRTNAFVHDPVIDGSIVRRSPSSRMTLPAPVSSRKMSEMSGEV